MPTGRFGHVVGSTPGSNLLYVFGGQLADDPEQGMVSALEVYNSVTNTWSNKAEWRGPKAKVNGIGLIGGKFYLPGGGAETGNGFEISKSLSIYDVASDTWSQGAPMPNEGSNGVSGVINGRLYVLTAQDNVEDECSDCGRVITRQLFRYNPANNRWASLRSAPHAHVDGAGGVINGKLYVAGGRDADGPSSRLEVYDPATNRWSAARSLPKPLPAITGVIAHGKFYVMGNSTNGDVFSYNPSTNRWSAHPSMPTPRASPGLGKAQVNGKARIFAIGGLTGDFDATGKQNEMFTP